MFLWVYLRTLKHRSPQYVAIISSEKNQDYLKGKWMNIVEKFKIAKFSETNSEVKMSGRGPSRTGESPFQSSPLSQPSATRGISPKLTVTLSAYMEKR